VANGVERHTSVNLGDSHGVQDALRKPTIYRYEDVAFQVNENAPGVTGLYRFYNLRSASHFFTASSTEAASVMKNWPTTFRDEGRSYKVQTYPGGGAVPVYRFYNMRNGSHFFTASAAEKDDVIAKYSNVYKFEDAVYWLPQ
jgi:hypothetical protein